MTFVLKLLGGLAIESDTAAVGPAVQQRRRLSLLALLALGGERGMSRDRIQAYMWPESDTGRARHALDQLLYSTRRDLGADAILPSNAADLRLNGVLVRPDLWLFDDAVRCERWSDAVDLYAGPLLDGTHLDLAAEFEQLLDSERLRREHDYHRALEALARHASVAGDLTAAVQWWRRRSLAEPTSLPVAVELMRALADVGDRAGAVQHARTYQRLVRETLEIEPDPSIERLAQRIAAGPAPAPVQTSITNAPSHGSRVETLTPASTTDTVTMDARDAGEQRERLSKSWWRPRRVSIALGFALALVVLPLIWTGVAARSNPSPLRARRPSDASGLPTDGAARVLYLRGRAEWNKRTKTGLDAAVVLYRRAIDRDPTFAAAYTGLAEAYVMLGYFGFSPTDATFPKARAAALRALELDPRAGEAYAALGQVLAGEHAWAEADQAYRRALQLSPNVATVHQWYALLFAYLGRSHEAAVHTAEASRLDPLSNQINNMYGMMLYYDHDLTGALRQYERTVVDEPDSAWVRQNPWVLTNFARVALAAGRYDQALHLVNRALVVVPTHPRALFDLAMVYLAKGDTATARAALARSDSTNPQYTADRACFYGLLGDFDRAYTLLDQIGEMPLPQLVTITNEPALAPMRADPRYARFRKKLGMPPA